MEDLELKEIDLMEFEDMGKQIKYRLVMKPVFNFSSVEMECEVTSQELQHAIRDFKYVYNAIKDTCIEDVPSAKGFDKKPKQQPKEELASEKQKETMSRFKIPYDENITMKEATRLISESKNKSTR